MLLVRGDYVWTGDELYADAAVWCDGDTIREVGPWQDLRSAHPDTAVVGGPGHIVMPGLINAHHHANGVSSFMAGVSDDALEPWLAALATAPACDPYLDTLWAAIGLLRGGYTTVAIFQSTGDPAHAGAEARARIKACLDAGIRVALGLDLTQQNFYLYGKEPTGLPPRRGLSTGQYIALLEELRQEYASEPRVEIFAAPSGPQWVTDEAWSTIGEWTKEHNVPLHTHCLESPYEAEYARRAYAGSAVAYLNRLGALHERTSLVHGVYLSEAELDLMNARRSSLITNPGSNLRLRCGISPVLDALERGVNVALGTDSCTLGERDDAWAEMRLLFYLQRGAGIPTPALTWKEPIIAATQAAAKVLPWGDRLGEIRPGAIADLSLFDWKAAAAPWSHPKHNPLQVLLQRASREHLSALVVGGEIVWEAGRGCLKVDAETVSEEIARCMDNVALPTSEGWTEMVRDYYREWPIPEKLSQLH